MTRTARAAFWLVPSVVCLALYWYGLTGWFFQDDFAWLGLRLQVWDFDSLMRALFAPMAQGTIRPLSERGFFLLYSYLFGLDALPYRITVFATMFANLALLAVIVRKLTGNAVAGAAASLLWLVNSALVTPMSWTSSYNEVLCTLVFLCAFYLLLRHIETGAWKYYWYQVLVFVAGFGVLEINVVYPALAAGYTLLCARRFFKRTLPLFAISGLYTWLHFAYSQTPASGPYAMHYDWGVLLTYFEYCRVALGGSGIDKISRTPAWVVVAAPWVLGTAIVMFAGWKAWRRNLLPVFGIAWFTVILAPVLPLRDHFSEYYLTMPLLGLGLIAGQAIADAAGGGAWKMRTALVILCGYYTFLQAPYTSFAMKWTYARSLKMRTLVNGVIRAHELHPGKVILLAGVTNDLFWAGVHDSPFRIFGAQVSLVPGSEKEIQLPEALGSLQDFVMPEAIARKALIGGYAVAYDVEGDKLRNVTQRYRRVASTEWKPELPRHIELGQALFSDQLGDGWYALEDGHRWMSPKATLFIGGPQSKGESLIVHGYCPPEQLDEGAVGFTATVNGKSLGTQEIRGPAPEFELRYPLSAEVVGEPKLTVTLEISRPYHAPNDPRILGVAYGSVSVR